MLFCVGGSTLHLLIKRQRRKAVPLLCFTSTTGTTSSTSRHVSSSSSSSHSSPAHDAAAPPGERLRIAIVGGGVAGLSTALHLAELVERGLVASPIDVFVADNKTDAGAGALRDIGVGVWSTGLTPFSQSWTRPSHQSCWDDWMRSGQWLGEVGYRSPSGTWLAKSTLPTEGSFVDFPGLLFLRERDLIQALQRGVHWEESLTLIKLHSGPKVTGIVEASNPFPYSAQLTLDSGEKTVRDYHLIIAAEGTYSNLRQRYGGHNVSRTRLTGTNVFNSDEDIQQDTTWKEMGQAVANAIEDRNYSVLRGNSPLTNAQIGLGGVSFQTWGEGKSMRFATVPLSFPSGEGRRVEQQVWFATTSDRNITDEVDPVKRKEELIQAFSSWHDPIARLMEATPADEILMERAVAHKHCVGPVSNIHRLVRELHQGAPLSAGPGPAMVFVGDSLMTVDPILAQGFTMALEGAHALAACVETACQTTREDQHDHHEHRHHHLAFDPNVLRVALQESHDERSNHRLVSLLRATELVQTLGQPQASLIGAFAKNVIRPVMQLTPNAIKTPIFNAVLKYSLGK
jgi:2-polyprenyl-6-methoxyphenol hydroxylase-like FAD-dependent oxidoreductase